MAEKIKEKASQISELHSRSAEFRVTAFAEDLTAQIDAINGTVAEAEDKLAGLQQAASTKDSELLIEQRLSNLTTGYKEFSTAATDIETQRLATETELNQSEAKVSELVRTRELLASEFSQPEADNSSLAAKLKLLREGLGQLRLEINSTRAKLRKVAKLVNAMEYARSFPKDASLTLPIEDVSDMSTLSKLTISFVPASQSGLLALMADVRDKKVSYFASAHVLNGQLLLNDMGGDSVTFSDVRLQPGNAYTAIIERYRRVLSVTVFDAATRRHLSRKFSLPKAGRFPVLRPYTSFLHLGGVPKSLAGLFPTKEPQWGSFGGNISRVALNGQTLNMWLYTEQSGVQLSPLGGLFQDKVTRYYMDGGAWATIKDAFGKASIKYLSDEQLEFELSTHCPDAALLTPPAEVSSRGGHGILELRLESGRLVAMAIPPADAPAARLESLARVDDGRQRSVRLEMRDRKLRLTVDGLMQAEKGLEPATFFNEFVLAPEPVNTSHSRFIGIVSGLSFNGNQRPNISFFGNSSRIVNASQDSLMSRFVRLSSDSVLELSLSRVLNSTSAVEVSAGFLARKLDGFLFKLRDDKLSKNFTVWLENGLLFVGQEYINRGRAVQDTLGQFLGMTESKFYNLRFYFKMGEVSLEFNGIRQNRKVNKNTQLQTLQLGQGFAGCVKDLVVNDKLIHLRSLLTVAAWGAAEFSTCGSSDADGHVGTVSAASAAGGSRLLDRCGRSESPQRGDFADAVRYNGAKGDFSFLGEPAGTIMRFGLTFRATEANGVLVMCDNLMENLLVFLYNGWLHLYNEIQRSFCRSVGSYADNKWHRLEFRKKSGSVSVDNETLLCRVQDTFYAAIPGSFKVTVGGLPADQLKAKRDITAQDLQTFSGCIKDVQLHGEGDVELKLPAPTHSGTTSCREDKEEGVGFQAASVARSLYSTAKVTLRSRSSISLMLKPRKSTGTVFGFVDKNGSGIKRAVTMHLSDGDVVVNFWSDGAASQEVRAAMASSYFLCNGAWHRVLVQIDFQRVRVWVDDHLSVLSALPRQFSQFDSLPFFGGLPDSDTADALSFLPGNYVGCLKAVQIDGEPAELGGYISTSKDSVTKEDCFVN